jgi:uncharacterized protein
MLCKRTYKNQITLPKKVMEKFDGVEYFEANVREGKIVLEPMQITPLSGTSLERSRKKVAALGLTEQDIEDAVAWAKKKITVRAVPGNRAEPAKPRVVLDTNVLVSALLFSGSPSKLVMLWQEGRIVLLISKEILLEYFQVLAYPKFSLIHEEIKALIVENVLPYAETINVSAHPPVISKDPADDKFLFLAEDGHARHIISGDKHLLSLEKYRGIEILPVRSFLESLK